MLSRFISGAGQRGRSWMIRSTINPEHTLGAEFLFMKYSAKFMENPFDSKPNSGICLHPRKSRPCLPRPATLVLCRLNGPRYVV